MAERRNDRYYVQLGSRVAPQVSPRRSGPTTRDNYQTYCMAVPVTQHEV